MRRVKVTHFCLFAVCCGTSHSVAGVFTTDIRIAPSSTGDHLIGEFDFGFPFSQVDSLELEFGMPSGYEGFVVTTGNSTWSRSLHLILHATGTTIEFEDGGLTQPPDLSVNAIALQVRSGEAARFRFLRLSTPIPASMPEPAFVSFGKPGHGRIALVDVYRSDFHPLPDRHPVSSSTSYAIAGEVTFARITIVGTPVPESGCTVMLLFASLALSGQRKKMMGPLRRRMAYVGAPP